MTRDARNIRREDSARPPIAELLQEWFSRHARALPWREDYDPYKILVSEFMLQQTQVETVLPYFERWMSAYPDLTSLAEADESSVVKLWEGLGYYSRCRNLLSAARAMISEGYTTPPASVEALSRYKGIGPYTAGAIASIAYNLPASAVDGNVERVAARLFDLEQAAGGSALKRLTAEVISKTMPEKEPRVFNQALMELGALVCLPKKPLCADCPCGSVCLAKQRGIQLSRPLPKIRPSVEKIQAWGALCFVDDRCLLRRRPDKGLWAGFWEIPWFARQTENAHADISAWGQEIGIECLSCEEIGTVRFSFTNHHVTAWFVICEARPLSRLSQRLRAGEWGLHRTQDLSRLALPSPSRKFLNLAHDPRDRSVFSSWRFSESVSSLA
ncbi:MAG: A/G-specific adenine glycosylase [Synergistaceae bacterium]|nr:A/G-specific adenine glycosylase [Synergistaceae bacterium]